MGSFIRHEVKSSFGTLVTVMTPRRQILIAAATPARITAWRTCGTS
jgi:hypothetical protein